MPEQRHIWIIQHLDGFISVSMLLMPQWPHSLQILVYLSFQQTPEHQQHTHLTSAKQAFTFILMKKRM